MPDGDGICSAADAANSATTTSPPLRALVAVSVIGQVYLLSVCASAADGGAVFDVADDNGTTTTALEKHGDEQRQQPLPNMLMLRAECKMKVCKRSVGQFGACLTMRQISIRFRDQS